MALLAIKTNLEPWWRQLVTVAYEQARGLAGRSAVDGVSVNFYSRPGDRAQVAVQHGKLLAAAAAAMQAFRRAALTRLAGR